MVLKSISTYRVEMNVTLGTELPFYICSSLPVIFVFLLLEVIVVEDTKRTTWSDTILLGQQEDFRLIWLSSAAFHMSSIFNSPISSQLLHSSFPNSSAFGAEYCV